MNKTIFTLLAAALFTAPACAQTQDTLPLLQKGSRTLQENQTVLNLFRTSKNPAEVFAAGASLVRLPPPAQQEPALFNIVLQSQDPLKKVFATVILTAMGNNYEEFLPMLADSAHSQDNALSAYAATAYTIIYPQSAEYADQVVNMYIYDEAFAQRAMNLISNGDKQTVKYLKQAAVSSNVKVRAAAVEWLGDLQTKEAAKFLLKRAKKELESEACSAVAVALAKNSNYTLEETLKNLRQDYDSPQANTYALALGFMTGNAINGVKQGLEAKDTNTQINAARAAAYMAGVLASPQAGEYSNDPDFDKNLLKTLVPQLSILSKRGGNAAKIYADTALYQMSKLNQSL